MKAQRRAARAGGRRASSARQAAEVERAIRFILERVAEEEKDFAMKVGEHLFRRLFRGNRALLRRGGRARGWGDEAIADIAADERVKIPLDKLYACIHTDLLASVHGRNAPGLPVPELSMWQWDRMWRLEGDPALLVRVAAWAAAERVPHGLIAQVVGILAPFLEDGGRIGDLLAAAKSGGRRAGKKVVERDERIAGVVEKWARRVAGSMAAGARAGAIGRIDAILAMLPG